MTGASGALSPDVSDLLESVPAGVLLLDEERRVEGANSEALAQLGRDDVVGLTLSELLGSDAAERLRADAAEVEVHRGGRTLLVRASPRRDYGYSLILVDVSVYERERARAERAARSGTEFLARLSHEIRSALASIIGFADLLKESQSHENRELADTITLSGQHLLQTLNSVLDLASTEHGQAHVPLTEVDVIAHVRDRVRIFRSAAERKRITLVVRAETGPIVTALNPTFLDRVIHNLIDNAIKYTNTGRVEVDVEAREGQVWIYVADTGIGIDPSFLPRLFDPFEREQPSEAATADGVGLGLHITKYLTELMGGRVTACSTKKEGSTFTVTFPLRPAD